MNIFLWVLQAVVGLYCVAGSLWRLTNYEAASKDVPSMAALPAVVWNALGLFEVICAVLLIVPGAFSWKPQLTPIAATCLAIEMLLVTGLHVKFFGVTFQATNPAVWTFGLCLAAAFIAYGRFVLKPY